MGSLPNLHTLESLAENVTSCTVGKKSSQTRDSSPERSVVRRIRVETGHRSVKQVRSVDRNIYHYIDRKPQDPNVFLTYNIKLEDLGIISALDGKLQENITLHTTERKLPLTNLTTSTSTHRTSQLLHASNQRMATLESNISICHSPVSSRSTRSSTTVTHQQHHCHYAQHHQGTTAGTSRHRESMSSSAGESSVHRLIGVVRSTPSQFGPVYSRRVIHKNWAAQCLANALLTSAIVPLLGLQSSISTWWWPPDIDQQVSAKWFYLSADIGSLLLGSLFAVGSLSSLFIVAVIKRLGTNTTMNVSYGCALLFFSAHLYPKLYTLMPSYFIMGLCLGPLAGARITALIALASKYSCVLSDEEACEIEHVCECSRRDVIIHMLARWMQTTQDCGLVFGNLFTGLVMMYTWRIAEDVHETREAIDSMFAQDEMGERICGAAACPVALDFRTVPPSDLSTNKSEGDSSLVMPCKSCMFLASAFIGFSIMAFIVARTCTDRLTIYHDFSDKHDFAKSYKVMTDTFKDPRLQLMVPLSLYIGLTQGFMFADFSKSYVVCSLDLYNVPWVFVALGVLQCIAGCTVNLVLQHIRRIYVISVGFTFQSCLILVLLRWKPTGDDSALLYVIGGVWGVCNSIWECLNFSLLIAIYPDTWQPAIGHHYFFRYLGLALAFCVHGAFCNHFKLYFMTVVLLLTAVSYMVLEWKLVQRPKGTLATL